MKHLDLRFFWLREVVQNELIALKHVGTADMPADILTKALGRVQVEECRKMMGLQPVASSGGSVS